MATPTMKEQNEIAELGMKLQTAFYLQCGRCNQKTIRIATHVGTIASELYAEGWRVAKYRFSALCPKCAEEKQ